MAKRKKKRKTFMQVYHLIERKSGRVIKWPIYGYSPSDIAKRKGTWDKRVTKLIRGVPK